MRCPIPIWKWIVVGLTIWLVLVLTGCGWGREVNRGATCPGAGSTLVAIGQWAVVAGSAAIGAGVLAHVASLFPWTAFLQAFRPLFSELIALGVTATLLGSSAIWLGTHPWLLVLVVALVVAGLVFRYRVRIGRWLGVAWFKKPKGMTNAC